MSIYSFNIFFMYPFKICNTLNGGVVHVRRIKLMGFSVIFIYILFSAFLFVIVHHKFVETHVLIELFYFYAFLSGMYMAWQFLLQSLV